MRKIEEIKRKRERKKLNRMREIKLGMNVWMVELQGSGKE